MEGGVTIDLSNMKEITIAGDQKTVSLGSGNRWGDVYNKIEPWVLQFLGDAGAMWELVASSQEVILHYCEY
jgi:hypothetical protein